MATIGTLIFRGKFGQIFEKTNVTLEEAEHLRCVDLGGIGRRPYTEMRLRMIPYGATLPSFDKLTEYAGVYRYKLYEFLFGWRAKLPELVDVSIVKDK